MDALKGIFSGQQVGPSALDMAKTELVVVQDLYSRFVSFFSAFQLFAFRRIAETCFEKCTKKFSNPEYEVGELTCIDRCTFKYMESHEKMLKMSEEWRQQQEAQAQAQAQLGQMSAMR